MAETRSQRSLDRSRRRFARRQWRRRAVRWRYVVGLVVVLALVAGGVWAVGYSSLLAVQDVQVRGADTVSASEVRSLSGITTGTPLVRVDAQQAQRRIEGSLAAVRTVDVTRHWPHTVVVTVHERVPVAVVSIGGRLRALDEEGILFGRYQQAPPGLPKVEALAGITTAALREAAAVVAALPDQLTTLVDHVSVQGVDQIQLVLGDGRVAIWGSSQDSTTKAQVLLTLLGHAEGKTYDVSVPSKPTVR